MMIKWLCLVGLICGLSWGTQAQSTRDVKATPKAPAPRYQSKKKSKEGFFLFRPFQKKQKTQVEEFRNRLQEQYEEKARAQKKADQPQYTDPTYFGHKKPPKKRKNGKKKFCKECGLTH